MALSLDDLPEKPAPAEPVSALVGRRVQASLVFARGGGTTVLSRQVVPYPFHITRAFRMHPESPDLATLYLQSASGGLYAADHLTLDIAARPGARVHVTTQAGTVVEFERPFGLMRLAPDAVPLLERTTSPLSDLSFEFIEAS